MIGFIYKDKLRLLKIQEFLDVFNCDNRIYGKFIDRMIIISVTFLIKNF